VSSENRRRGGSGSRWNSPGSATKSPNVADAPRRSGPLWANTTAAGPAFMDPRPVRGRARGANPRSVSGRHGSEVLAPWAPGSTARESWTEEQGGVTDGVREVRDDVGARPGWACPRRSPREDVQARTERDCTDLPRPRADLLRAGGRRLPAGSFASSVACFTPDVLTIAA
jgi:hypothetical protein